MMENQTHSYDVTVATYIAFLRAINLGSTRRVKMDRLREVFTELGFDNVRTYIASGNVFFESASRSKADLTKKIEARLVAEFGFEIPTMLRTIAEVEKAVARNSFRDVTVDDDTRLVVLFADGPVADLALPVASPNGALTVVDANGSELFVVMRIIDGRVPNPATWVKKTFLVETTARFAHTLEKIVAAANA